MNTKTTVVLALLVVIGGVLLVLERPWEDVDKKRAAEKLADQAGRPQRVIEPSVDAQSIERVELACKGRPPIVAERDGDGWKITQPIECLAQPWLPGHIINRCLELKYTRKFAPDDEGAPTAAEAGLDQPLATVTLHPKDQKPDLVFHFGRQAPLSTNYYAAIEGKDFVYIVNEDVRRTFNRTLDEFRGKKLFNFASDEVKTVTVAGAHNYELARDQDNKWTIQKPVRARTNKTRTASLVSSLRNLTAVDFVDDQPTDLAPYGLDRPSWTIALVVEKTVTPEPSETQEEAATTEPAPESQPAPEPEVERSEHTLLIGGPAGKNRYAKLADHSWVFTIAETTLTTLTPDLLELRDKTLCDFDRKDVEKIELQVGDAHETLTKKGDDWTLSGGLRAEPIAVDDLLNTLEGLQAAAFQDQPPLVDPGLDSPRATISLFVSGRVEPARLVIGNPTASGKMVYTRAGQDPTIALLREETVRPLLVPPIGYRDRQILDFNKALVSGIEITRQGQTFSLTESFGQWRMVAPIEAPADSQSVTNILADLNNLRAKAVVASGPDADYGLDDPWVRAKLTVRPSSDKSKPQSTGESPETQPAETQPADTQPAGEQAEPATPDGKIYARRQDRELIYEVDHTVLDNLLAELHDRKAFPIDRATRIATLTFRTRDSAFTLEQVVHKSWIVDVDPALPIDPKKVDAALNSIRQLRTGKFVDYQAEDLAPYGLDDPAISLSFTDKFGESGALIVSARGPENDPQQSRYATLVGSNKVFLLPLNDLGALNKTVSDFEKTE
jgi:hypothetical protein